MLKIISELFAPKCGSIKFAKYLEGFYNIDPCYSNFNHSLRSSFNEEKVFTFFSPLKLPVIADAKNVQKEQKINENTTGVPSHLKLIQIITLISTPLASTPFQWDQMLE